MSKFKVGDRVISAWHDIDDEVIIDRVGWCNKTPLYHLRVNGKIQPILWEEHELTLVQDNPEPSPNGEGATTS